MSAGPEPSDGSRLQRTLTLLDRILHGAFLIQPVAPRRLRHAF
jgi:hypothetical protein